MNVVPFVAFNEDDDKPHEVREDADGSNPEVEEDHSSLLCELLRGAEEPLKCDVEYDGSNDAEEDRWSHSAVVCTHQENHADELDEEEVSEEAASTEVDWDADAAACESFVLGADRCRVRLVVLLPLGPFVQFVGTPHIYDESDEQAEVLHHSHFHEAVNVLLVVHAFSLIDAGIVHGVVPEVVAVHEGEPEVAGEESIEPCPEDSHSVAVGVVPAEEDDSDVEEEEKADCVGGQVWNGVLWVHVQAYLNANEWQEKPNEPKLDPWCSRKHEAALLLVFLDGFEVCAVSLVVSVHLCVCRTVTNSFKL